MGSAEIHDVLIIGAGLGGLLCAHRLQQAGAIFMWWKHAHLGGRVASVSHRGAVAEFGGTWFAPRQALASTHQRTRTRGDPESHGSGLRQIHPFPINILTRQLLDRALHGSKGAATNSPILYQLVGEHKVSLIGRLRKSALNTQPHRVQVIDASGNSIDKTYTYRCPTQQFPATGQLYSPLPPAWHRTARQYRHGWGTVENAAVGFRRHFGMRRVTGGRAVVGQTVGELRCPPPAQDLGVWLASSMHGPPVYLPANDKTP